MKAQMILVSLLAGDRKVCYNPSKVNKNVVDRELRYEEGSVT